MLWVLQMMQWPLSQFNHDRLNHSSINSTQVKTRNSENRNSISKTRDSKDLLSCHVHFDPSTSHSVLKSLNTGSILTLKLTFHAINNHHDNHFHFLHQSQSCNLNHWHFSSLDHHFHCSSPIISNPSANLFFTICSFRINYFILSHFITHAVISIFNRQLHKHLLSSLILNFSDQHLPMLLLSWLSFTHQFDINQRLLTQISHWIDELDNLKFHFHFNSSLNIHTCQFLTPHDQSALSSFCFVVI